MSVVNSQTHLHYRIERIYSYHYLDKYLHKVSIDNLLVLLCA